MIRSRLKGLRRRWQIWTGRYDTPFDGEFPVWVASVCLQLVLLGVLAKVLLPDHDSNRNVFFVAEQNEVVEIADPNEPEIEFKEFDISQLNNQSEVNLEIVQSVEQPLLDLDEQPPVEVDVAIDDIGTELFVETTFDNSSILSTVSTVGSVGNVAAKATGAVDRLTQEILESLEERSTMVVWLFDQSASLERQRSEIERRIDRIYGELNLLQDANSSAFEKPEDKPLLTQVYAFGQQVFRVLDKPTDDVEEIKSAINSVARDTSGIENVFSAILRCEKDLRSLRQIDRNTGQRKRNVMFIVLSDEAGDDGQLVDRAIRACDESAIPVYVIGVPAPFGRAESRVKWVDPDPQYDQRPQIALVSQGPESIMPERLQLNFVGGDFRDLEMIDSGFGPFNLTRLCYQTGGIYFAVHPNRRAGRVNFRETSVYASDLRYFFTPEAMNRYLPDYVSLNEYRRRINENRARLALVTAAAVPVSEQLQAPQFRFPKFNEANYIRQLSSAQQAAAILQPRLDQLYSILKEGELDREKEPSPRWQAGYDLAFGRVIAALLRSKSYNEMLAIAKTRLNFTDEKNNTWVLRPSDDLSSTGSQNEKLAEKARTYLTRVIEKHPNTPWALLAKRELSSPLGWQWRETFTEPPAPRPPRPNNNNNNPRNPQPRQNQTPKKLRPIPKL